MAGGGGNREGAYLKLLLGGEGLIRERLNRGGAKYSFHGI